MTTLIMRPCRNEDDYWRIRAFLREVMIANGLREWSWHVARLDYWRWHVAEVVDTPHIARMIFIWEAPGGEIGAVLNPEGPGDAFLQIHPRFSSPELEAEMLDTAEAHLGTSEGRLVVYTDAGYTRRCQLLQDRGYTKGQYPEHQWRRDLDDPLPKLPLIPGYTLRARRTRRTACAQLMLMARLSP